MMAARKRTMREALAGAPKRALGTSVYPSAALSISVLGRAVDVAHTVQDKVLAKRARTHASETLQAKIATRKVQAKDPDKFLRKALAERQRRAK